MAKPTKRSLESSDAGKSENYVFELGKRKQVTVSKFNNKNLVDIREFYIDKESGQQKPTRKGISLTEDVWMTLLENKDKIQQALDALAGRQQQSSSNGDAAQSGEPKEKKQKRIIEVEDSEPEKDADDIEDLGEGPMNDD